jgi:asparagine synthase (glutamine-hydrolysing)
MKSLIGECNKFQNFPPGHVFCSTGEKAGEFQRWYKPNWAPEMLPGGPMPKETYQAVSEIEISEYVLSLVRAH